MKKREDKRGRDFQERWKYQKGEGTEGKVKDRPVMNLCVERKMKKKDKRKERKG